jgi:hypothetical protein
MHQHQSLSDWYPVDNIWMLSNWYPVGNIWMLSIRSYFGGCGVTQDSLKMPRFHEGGYMYEMICCQLTLVFPCECEDSILPCLMHFTLWPKPSLRALGMVGGNVWGLFLVRCMSWFEPDRTYSFMPNELSNQKKGKKCYDGHKIKYKAKGALSHLLCVQVAFTRPSMLRFVPNWLAGDTRLSESGHHTWY